jgi:hypothetical protein
MSGELRLLGSLATDISTRMNRRRLRWNSNSGKAEYDDPTELTLRDFVTDGKDYRWRLFQFGAGITVGSTVAGIPLVDATYGHPLASTIKPGMRFFVYRQTGGTTPFQFATFVDAVDADGTVHLVDPLPAGFTNARTVAWGWPCGTKITDALAELAGDNYFTKKLIIDGIYRPDNVFVPNATMHGTGIGHTGGWRGGSLGPINLAQQGSVLWQMPDFAGTRTFKGVLGFTNPITTATPFCGPFDLDNFSIEGPEAQLVQGASASAVPLAETWGIWSASADGVETGWQDNCFLDRVMVASCHKSMKFVHCAPGVLGRLRSRYCGGAADGFGGIDIDHTTGNYQDWDIESITSDGCQGGAIRISRGSSQDAIRIGTIKSEMGQNGNFFPFPDGSTPDDAHPTLYQESALILDGLDGSSVELGRVRHLGAVTTRPNIKAPGPAVKIINTLGGGNKRPLLNVSGYIRVRMKGTEVDTTRKTVAIDDQVAGVVRGAATIGIANDGFFAGPFPADASARSRDPLALVVGEAIFGDRRLITSYNTLTSQSQRRTVWVCQKTQKGATKVKVFVGTAAVGTLPTKLEIAVEDVSEGLTPTYDVTKSTFANADIRSALVTGVNNVAVTITMAASKDFLAGKMYVFSILKDGTYGTTEPTLAAGGQGLAANLSSDPPVGSQTNSSTSIPASATKAAAFGSAAVHFYAEIHP